MVLTPIVIYINSAGTSGSVINSISVYNGVGNIVAAAGICYDIPAGSLTANTNIDLSALVNSTDYIEVCNRDIDFRLIFTGKNVYLSDETIQTDAPALINMQIRNINGKLRIIN